MKLSNFLSKIKERQNVFFKENPTLILLDIPSENILKKIAYKLDGTQHQFVFARTLYCDVKLGTVFNTIIVGNICINTKAVLKYVSINNGYDIDYFPDGYSGICYLEFPFGIPDCVTRLPIYGEPKDIINYEVLYLTQKILIE